jgi:hypothetical protein
MRIYLLFWVILLGVFAFLAHALSRRKRIANGQYFEIEPEMPVEIRAEIDQALAKRGHVKDVQPARSPRPW